jgi:hypothetical protein
MSLLSVTDTDKGAPNRLESILCLAYGAFACEQMFEWIRIHCKCDQRQVNLGRLADRTGDSQVWVSPGESPHGAIHLSPKSYF